MGIEITGIHLVEIHKPKDLDIFSPEELKAACIEFIASDNKKNVKLGQTIKYLMAALIDATAERDRLQELIEGGLNEAITERFPLDSTMALVAITKCHDIEEIHKIANEIVKPK